MTWLDDMKRDAARVAFPDLELEEGFRVEIAGDFTEGFRESSWTFADPEFKISVAVWFPRGDLWECAASAKFRDAGAQKFFTDLMEAGSRRPE